MSKPKIETLKFINNTNITDKHFIFEMSEGITFECPWKHISC